MRVSVAITVMKVTNLAIVSMNEHFGVFKFDVQTRLLIQVNI